MKRLVFSPLFQKKLRLINHRDQKLSLKIQKQLKLFQVDPRHPSLRRHKLKGELKNVWSLSIDRGFRLLFVEDEEYYFFDLGEHGEIYQ